MQGRIIVHLNNKEAMNKITEKSDVLDVCQWIKERYQKYTTVYYLDGSIEFDAKEGFLLSDMKGKFTPVK